MALPTTGLTLRLESDAGVTYDANGVSAWADQSAAAFPDFVQTTDDNKPARITNCFGVQPGLYFDGVNDVLSSTGAPNALVTEGAKDIFIVFRPISGAASGNYNTAPAVLSDVNNSLAVCSIFTAALTNAWFGGALGVLNYTAQMLKGKAYLLEFGGVTGAYFVRNNIVRSLEGLSGMANTTPSGSAGMVIGKAGAAANYLGAYIGAIICYNRALTEKERYDTKEYLRIKFNVTVPHVFVDGSMADDTSTDPKMTTAHKFVQTAVTKYSGYYGTRIVCRRTIDEVIAASVTPTGAGTQHDPITIMGMPRNEITGLTGTFTQGSRSVSAVSGATLSLAAHETRLITAPDGKIYGISRVTGTDTFNMFTPYIGATSVGGTFKINKDELYDEIQTLTAYDGADALSTWNADAHARTKIQNTTINRRVFNVTTAGWMLRDLFFQINATGGFFSSTQKMNLVGVTIEGTVNDYIYSSGYSVLNVYCCTIKGSNNAAHTFSFVNITTSAYPQRVIGRMLSIYDCSTSLQGFTGMFLDLKDSLFGADGASKGGIEIRYASALSTGGNDQFYLDNCLFGAATEISRTSSSDDVNSFLKSSNHNQIKDYHKLNYFNFGTIVTNTDTGVTLRNSANCPFVLEGLFNIAALALRGIKLNGGNKNHAIMFFEHRIRVSQLKNYRVYINSDDYLCNCTAYLEIEYVDAASGTGLHTAIVKSTGEIAAKTGESDWTQYLEPPSSIQPAVESEVAVRLFISYYHPTNKIYVDPYIDDIGIAPTVFQGMANIGQKYVPSAATVPLMIGGHTMRRV